MSYTAEDFVRHEVGKVLRVDNRGKCLCSSCLVTLVSATFSTVYTKAQTEEAIGNMFSSPGALTHIPSLIACAKCGQTLPCLRG